MAYSRRLRTDNRARTALVIDMQNRHAQLSTQERKAVERTGIPPGAKLAWSDELNKMVWK